MRDQSKAFLTYFFGVRSHARDRKYDMVLATSSRLMTAVLGANVARAKRVPLYLDIRDIFVDTIGDVFPRGLGRPLSSVFSFVERYAIDYAKKVNLVSHGFESYFSQRYPKQHFSFFPNGIDDEFIETAPTGYSSPAVSALPYSVVYAGNLGEGQGLHTILPKLALAMRGRARFTVIGDGGRKLQLQKALADAGVDNVTMLDPVGRSALISAYREADVLFLHLNDYDAFRKVLPSKLFEYASIGKPIWAGVSGYAAEFVEREIENAAVFPPCDVSTAAEVFDNLKLETVGRDRFIKKYARSSIMAEMACDIVSILQRNAN